MKNNILFSILLVVCTACGPSAPPQETVTPARRSVNATLTETLASGAPVIAGAWRTADAPAGALLIVAAGDSVEFYAADGEHVGGAGKPAAGMLVVVPDVSVAGNSEPLVVVYDTDDSSLAGYVLDRDALSLRAVMAAPQPVADELTGLCHYRSGLSGTDYLYAATDSGMVLQYELYAGEEGLGLQLLRSIPSGKGSGYCAVDARDAMLYVSEESTGIWRLGAEPESDTTREPVDLREPFGALSDDLKGVAIVPAGADTSYLLVADVGKELLALYSLPDAVRVAGIKVDGLGEAEGVTAIAGALGDRYPAGLIAIADEDDTGAGPNVKLLDWQDLASAAGLPEAGAASTAAHPVVVRPVRETDVMPNFGDAADDPAIWVHPEDPSLSLVIGTNKKAGLHVFDLQGHTLQVLPDGRMNNVDLRGGFSLGGKNVTLVTASNRSDDSIAVYRVDADARRLVEVADGVLATGFPDPYGACMYRDPAAGEVYVFINENGSGRFRQWRLFDNGSGKVRTEQVREFEVGSQAEGCVADDETGALYVAEEDVGLWRYAAAADGGDERTLVDSVENGRLTDDVEGVALYAAANGQGYVVVSNQGADNYALYRRDDNNAWVGFFHIVANAAAGIDGASETDGLDVTSAPLGDAFPDGLLVVQDGRNIAPEEPQNFKFVSWADVASAMGIDD